MIENRKGFLINQITSEENQIKELREYFKKLWSKSKPLAKLFKTSSNNYYLYDTGTNKISGCEDAVFKLLEFLLSMEVDKAIDIFLQKFTKEQFVNTANKIKTAIEKENVLLSQDVCGLGLSHHRDNIEELIHSSLGILILEITEDCNLRCRYCIYNPHVKYKRNYGKSNMTLSVAHRAIDYLKKHSYNKGRVAVTFYGGEPLLRFKFIKSIVEYSKTVLPNKEIIFSVTTNGTLLTHEICEFFLKNNFNVVVSIDGPQEIHDSYRKDVKGNGSFNKTIKGLKNLIDVYGEHTKEKLLLSMVYTPPFSQKRIERITELWEEMAWIPKEMGVSITYPAFGSILNLDNFKEDKNLLSWACERFLEDYTEKGRPHPIVRSVIERQLALLVQRPIFSKPFHKYPLNGCCIPGARRLFVSTKGIFYPCERIPTTAPSIGDVYSGIDLMRIKDFYIKEYERMSLPNCSQCWTIRLCNFCYAEGVEYDGLNLKRREESCIAMRSAKEKLLTLLCELIEKDSKGLEYLYEFRLE